MPRMSTFLIVLLLIATAQLFGQPLKTDAGEGGWKAMQTLAGEWVGEGGGQPGQARRGGFTFTPDLQGVVLVRKSFAEYPASQTRPAFRHDDLTVVYRTAPGSAPRATYFDNEGHVIEYEVSASSDGSRIEWLSSPQLGQPRFRLTYTLTSPDALKLRFEIAPPDQPEKFSLYLEASARRTHP